MARNYLRQAQARIQTAKTAVSQENYAYAVRQSQEAVKLSLKATLRLIGIEPPRWHDVGPAIRRYRNRFPQWFQESIGRFYFISRPTSKRKKAEYVW